MKQQGLANRLTEYGDREFALYLRRSFAKSMGYSDEALDKPIVGIINTFSELNNCHRGFRELAEAVKRGVWQAGGLPLEFPTISLGEVFLYPTSMMLRNLMSMDVEVMLRAQLVLQNAGPVGAPGMPEAGYLPIPKKLTGVKDLVRISDARMSGTAFGTIVLHVSPEAAIGGPLGLVRDGDLIELSVGKRQLNLLVDDRELEARRAQQAPAMQCPARGYERLYHQSVQQAHLGMDFDFLRHESLQSR